MRLIAATQTSRRYMRGRARGKLGTCNRMLRMPQMPKESCFAFSDSRPTFEYSPSRWKSPLCIAKQPFCKRRAAIQRNSPPEIPARAVECLRLEGVPPPQGTPPPPRDTPQKRETSSRRRQRRGLSEQPRSLDRKSLGKLQARLPWGCLGEASSINCTRRMMRKHRGRRDPARRGAMRRTTGT